MCRHCLHVHNAQSRSVVVATADVAPGSDELSVLSSHSILLNGVPMAPQADGSLPRIPFATQAANSALTLPPLSFAFLVFTDVPDGVCG